MIGKPPRQPGLGIRMKLTLSYVGLLVFAGMVLFAVVLVLLHYVPEGHLTVVETGAFAPRRIDLMRQAVKLAVWGTIFLAFAGFAAGWLLAGQMLRPLERITTAARAAADGSLSHRIALPGRDDELHQLADTFDTMLARLEKAFEEQRRFTANASHELRTPQTVMKTMLQVAQANPGAVNLETFLTRLQEMNDRSIDTHEALLQLARPERGDLHREPCDLAEVTRDVLVSHEGVGTDLNPVVVTANLPLLRQLVDNLVRNAVIHNRADDPLVRVSVGAGDGGRARLEVVNAGPVLSEEVVATLTEPFVRGAGRTRRGRTPGGAGGSGLGLAIVASIARAHRADLRLRPRAEGGLIVTVTFPRT
ncbi:sensor histidine kinase [Kineosporia succinea]|uniref:histidine kinase n=1 Tax=Kineosporia succinea TaxID=84632 RepID=A0ABT9PCK7_9ACTN|nr:HAMP domain-containing sensor histidine kinase [Kineosporia succinea]MDP9830439.1 two-component system sensor histidine kinase VanS [Kineosporia succinea]